CRIRYFQAPRPRLSAGLPPVLRPRLGAFEPKRALNPAFPPDLATLRWLSAMARVKWPFTAANSRQTMAKEGQTKTGGLEAIVGAAGEAARKGPPPVHLWN